MDRSEIGSTEIRVVLGDITQLDVDAVVNAANERLSHGGGVAAAISRAGGPAVQEESDQWVAEHGPLTRGRAAVTTAGAMPARVVIHVVGPRYRAGRDNETHLANTVVAALDAAAANDVRTLALPAISSGIFGYPRSAATAVIARTVGSWVRDHPGVFDDVFLVGVDQGTTDDWRAALGGVGTPGGSARP